MILLIFGLVLFPSEGDSIDLASMNIFLDVKVKDEDSAPTLHTNICYTIYLHHLKKWGMMLCCALLLQKRIFSHLPKDVSTTRNLSKHELAQYLVSLTEKSTNHRVLNREDMISSCGDFPNVSLIGSRGCINYNPTLAMR